MEIAAKDSFFDSLKTYLNRHRWYNRLYDYIRYDIPNFFRNVWIFRKALREYHWWDSHGTMMFMKTSFDHMAPKFDKHGIEIESSRNKKIMKMRRAAELLENYLEDKYIELAEKELGEIKYHPLEFEPAADHTGCYTLVDRRTKEEREHERKVFEFSRTLEEAQWNELFEILKGQDYFKFSKDKDWDDQFDGSGIRGWWD